MPKKQEQYDDDKDRSLNKSLGNRGDSKELMLTSYYGAEGSSQDEAIAAIKEQCGWDLKVAPDVRREPPPTLEELAIVRKFSARRGDPEE